MENHHSVKAAMSAKDWGLLLTLSVLWGGSFFFNDIGVNELPVFTLVFGRVFLASVILWGVLLGLRQGLPIGLHICGRFFAMGLLNNAIPFCLIVWGQTQIASGLAAILNATTPLFTILIAHMMTRDEKLSPLKLIGVILGFAGVALMIGFDLLMALGPAVVAQVAVLVGAISYACAGIYGRRFKALGVSPMQTAAGQLTASSVMLLPLMVVVDQPWTLPVPSVTTLLALMGLAALSTALAYVLYFRILAAAGATNLLLVTFLIPVSAILLGIMVLGEVLKLQHMAGMALIGAGLAVIDGRPLKALRLKAPQINLNTDRV